ncbi:hypothetical protein E1B28_003590 [Marasmius oreades]|uniref:Secreted protein n=1 Tax=Marasmius oreades TaxID=181124 RepID=A0A9P7RM95_9AGAR|nr:uncharacterized protein E1B28_003590 [Marasmius oreades]KAG7086070.1 hypothetical protein E1B28_003590 [Marasmius oreades]
MSARFVVISWFLYRRTAFSTCLYSVLRNFPFDFIIDGQHIITALRTRSRGGRHRQPGHVNNYIGCMTLGFRYSLTGFSTFDNQSSVMVLSIIRWLMAVGKKKTPSGSEQCFS